VLNFCIHGLLLRGQGGAYSERGKALFFGTGGSKRFFFEKKMQKTSTNRGVWQCRSQSPQ
jgi:hypothetical protein